MSTTLVFSNNNSNQGQSIMMFRRIKPRPCTRNMLSNTRSQSLTRTISLRRFILGISMNVVQRRFIIMTSITIRQRSRRRAHRNLTHNSTLLNRHHQGLNYNQKCIILNRSNIRIKVKPSIRNRLRSRQAIINTHNLRMRRITSTRSTLYRKHNRNIVSHLNINTIMNHQSLSRQEHSIKVLLSQRIRSQSRARRCSSSNRQSNRGQA